MAIWFSGFSPPLAATVVGPYILRNVYEFVGVVKGGVPNIMSSSVGPVRGSANFPYCPEVSKYEKLAKVGQGTFG